MRVSFFLELLNPFCIPFYVSLGAIIFTTIYWFFPNFYRKSPYLTVFVSILLIPVFIATAFFVFVIIQTPPQAYPNAWLCLNPIKVSDYVTLQAGRNEIIPPRPLPAYGINPKTSPISGERLVLYVRNLGVCPSESDLRHTICLKNGNMIRLEGFIYDDKGQKYEICITSSSIELSPCSTESLKTYFLDFPKGEYTKIELMVDKPLEIDSIYWEGESCIEIM